jgi:hypothetical protein
MEILDTFFLEIIDTRVTAAQKSTNNAAPPAVRRACRPCGEKSSSLKKVRHQ